MANFVGNKESLHMTELFKKAVEKAAEEFPDYEQDEFGRWLLEAIESDERQWDLMFSDANPAALDKLNELVRKTRERIRKGQTEALDLKKL
jgi:hypothetical protein